MPPIPPKNILVVEDDLSMISAVEYSLTEKGYSVQTAPNAEKGLSLVRKAQFDLFIVDLVLPGIHGFELVRKVRKLPCYSRTPILIITGKIEARDDDVVLRAGADEILTKPFEMETLQKRVEALLAR
jgi:DNA-binding response OmpR family regulator